MKHAIAPIFRGIMACFAAGHLFLTGLPAADDGTLDCIQVLTLQCRQRPPAVRYAGQFARDSGGLVFRKPGWPDSVFLLIITTSRYGTHRGAPYVGAVRDQLARLAQQTPTLGWESASRIFAPDPPPPRVSTVMYPVKDFDWLDAQKPDPAHGPILYVMAADHYRYATAYAVEKRGYAPATWRAFDYPFGLEEPSVGPGAYVFVAPERIVDRTDFPDRACVYLNANQIHCYFEKKRVAIVKFRGGFYTFTWTGAFKERDARRPDDERLVSLVRSVTFEVIQRGHRRSMDVYAGTSFDDNFLFFRAGFRREREVRDEPPGDFYHYYVAYEHEPVKLSSLLPRETAPRSSNVPWILRLLGW